jgi:outer membrane protein insertion porin family
LRPGLTKLWLAGVLAAVLLLAVPALAQFSGGVVEEVRVEGNQRIEAETVRSYMSIRAGDPFEPQRINRSLKSLFATGLFADVSIRREGPALIVAVIENPIINRLAFEGNRRVTDETLEQEAQLRPRQVYTRTKVQNDVKRVLEVYRRSGRFAATVEPKVIELPQNRVDLVFEIDEGPVTGVTRINFIGNRVFSDGKLRSAIQTKESRWYRIFSTDDNYDPDRLTFDRELLRRFYLSEGYADFRVVSAVAELTPDRRDFIITFTVEEGELYGFGPIEITTQFEDLETETLRGQVVTLEGERYNADLVEDSINNLTDAVGDLGYAFVDIQPIIDRDRENRTIKLTYDIQEGPRVFVERIEIVGNFRTLDEVVRREFRLVEGDAFSTAKLRRSRERINNLGFFGKAEVTTIPGSEPDKTIIQVEVEEQSTGELSIGAGFSTQDGPLGDISIRERNLLGKGQDLRARFRLSSNTSEFDVSFTEPYFLDKNLSAGVDLFHITRDVQEESSFDQRSFGGGVRIGYEIIDGLRQIWRYTLRQDQIREVGDDASRFIQDQEGDTITSMVGQTITYDRRDNRFDPHEGYFVQVGNDVAGLGGSVRYLRNTFGAGKFWPITDTWTFGVTGEAGIIFGLGERIRINDRFFLGGDSLRGFEPAGTGPRDNTTQDSLGGKRFYTTTAELSFPIGLPEELGVAGKLFVDAGNASDPDDEGPEVVDSNLVRTSVGVGIAWRSPFGPIRVDLAEALIKEDFDKTQLLHFSFGTRF